MVRWGAGAEKSEKAISNQQRGSQKPIQMIENKKTKSIAVDSGGCWTNTCILQPTGPLGGLGIVALN